MNTKNLLTCKNIELYFEKEKNASLNVLSRINFSLAKGEIVAILGQSGAGKSSFLRIIAGLLKPSFGSALYKDQPINEPLEDCGFVFQNFALLPWLSVLDNVLFGVDAKGIKRKQSVNKA